VRKNYGENTTSLAQAFMQFLQQQRIRQDVKIAMQQLDNQQGIPAKTAFEAVRSRYE
jgi:hypothetical protein